MKATTTRQVVFVCVCERRHLSADWRPLEWQPQDCQPPPPHSHCHSTRSERHHYTCACAMHIYRLYGKEGETDTGHAQCRIQAKTGDTRIFVRQSAVGCGSGPSVVWFFFSLSLCHPSSRGQASRSKAVLPMMQLDAMGSRCVTLIPKAVLVGLLYSVLSERFCNAFFRCANL